MVKKILLGLLTLAVLITAGNLTITWLSIKDLEKISDSRSFALSFDTANKPQANLEVGGFMERTIKSPYFPYITLKTEALKSSYPHIIFKDGKTIDLTEKGVYINTDTFWNIFWVEITPEAQAYGKTQFYGPYGIK